MVYCFAYADTVRTGQLYHTKGIYEETCKIHPYFCIVVLIFNPCVFVLFICSFHCWCNYFFRATQRCQSW